MMPTMTRDVAGDDEGRGMTMRGAARYSSRASLGASVLPLPACGERVGVSDCVVGQAFCHGRCRGDGVEDGEEFSGCCDEGDHLGLSGGDEAVAEGLEGWVVTGGGHGGEEEDGAHGGAASADEAPAAPPP